MNEILLVNPRRRRRKTTTRRRRKTTTRRRRRNPTSVARPRRRRRRNQVRARQWFTAPRIQRNLTVASQGAFGALGLDIALAYIPLPAQLTGPIATPVIKGLGAMALGMFANMAGARQETAVRMTEGALTVQLHGIFKQLTAQFAPAVPLSAYVGQNNLGYYGSGYNPAIDDPDWTAGMGTYLTDISSDDISMDQGGFAMYENQAGFGW